MLRKAIIVGTVALVVSCSGGTQDDRTVTKREADSALGASSLPGASGITRALGASDSAAARATLLDSLSRSP